MSDRPSFPPYEARTPGAPSALGGVRVVDFTRVVAGPYGSMILADLGAEVIKVEDPTDGDLTRFVPPRIGETGVYFVSNNRTKKSVTIDLASAEGRAVALDLIGNADVLMENYTTRVMKQFGLDYASLATKFPNLIYCSVSAYGRSGSRADAPGYDPIIQSETGLLSLNYAPGEPGRPFVSTISFVDFMAAMNGTIGILAALQARHVLRRGQHIDVSLYDTAMSCMHYRGYEYLALGMGPLPIGRLSKTSAPGGEFEASDGTFWLMITSDKMYHRLCIDVLERPDLAADPRFAKRADRVRNYRVIADVVREIFPSNSLAYWIGRMAAAKIPSSAVRSLHEACVAPEAVERNAISSIPHREFGQVPNIASVFRRMSLTPATDPVAAPSMGQHTDEVLAAVLGYGPERIAELRRSGALGPAPAIAAAEA